MELILVFLMLCSGSVLAATFGRRGEEAMPLTAGGIVLLLYAFYLADRLLWGYWLALTLCTACYAVSAWRFYIRRGGVRTLLSRLCTPAMAILALLCLAYWLLVRGNAVNAWDELRLWAAYPKALFVSERLQLGADAYLFSNMQSYPPGMPLFCYFVEKLSGGFTSGKLYWAYAVFGAMLALPALKNLRWKRYWMNAAALLLLFVLPMFFGNSGNDGLYAYRSLYIDTLLGLALGCTVYQLSENCYASLFTAARLALLLALLVLLKDSGALLALLVLLAAVLLGVRRDTARPGPLAVRVGLTAALPALAYGLWQLRLGNAGVENHVALTSSAEDASFLPAFFERLLKDDIVSSPVFNKWGGPELASYFTTGLLCLGLALLVWRLFEGARRRRQGALLLVMLGLNAAYIAGLYLLFRNGYGGGMPSLERYVSTIAQANITLTALCFLEAGQERIEKTCLRTEWSKLALTLSVAALVAVFPLGLDRRNSETAEAAQSQAAEIAAAVAEDAGEAHGQVSCYLAFPRGETELLHHELYYYLMDARIRVTNFYDNTCINRGEDATAGQIAEIRNALFASLRQGDCTYLYFARDIPLAGEQMGDLFSGDTAAGTLYRVEPQGDGFRMMQIAAGIS